MADRPVVIDVNVNDTYAIPRLAREHPALRNLAHGDTLAVFRLTELVDEDEYTWICEDARVSVQAVFGDSVRVIVLNRGANLDRVLARRGHRADHTPDSAR